MVKTQNVDVDLLQKAIDASGLKTKFLSDSLGISPQAFNSKRRGQTAFRKSEVFVMQTLLHLSDKESNQIFFP